MAQNEKITSAEQAEEILLWGFSRLDEAIEYLKANDKDNAVLSEYFYGNYSGDIDALKKDRAVEVLDAKRVDEEFNAAQEYLNSLDSKAKDLAVKQAEKDAEDIQNVILDANNVKIPAENSEAIEKNIGWLDEALKTNFEKSGEDGVPAWRTYNADLLNKMKFTDSKGKENKELRQKSEDTIWEISKGEVLRTRSFDFDFMKLKEADRLKLLRADIADSFAKTSLGMVGITPVVNEPKDGEVNAEDLAKSDADKFMEALDKFLSDKKEDKAVVNKDVVIGAALDEDQKMGGFINTIEAKQYSEPVVEKFKSVRKNFSEKMKSFWGKAWTGAKEYVANNRTRVLVDIAATTAVALSPVSMPVVAAYAAYATIGSFVWPIVEKRKKAIRMAKQQGRNYDDYKMGYTFKGLRQAWKDIKSDSKEYKRYKNRAYTSAAAGVVFGGLLGAAGTGLVNGMSAMTAKVSGTIMRSLSSVTSQAMNFKDAKKDLKLEDNAENRAAYKNAKWGLIIGGAIAAVGAGFGIKNLMDANVEVNDANTANGGMTPNNETSTNEAVEGNAEHNAAAEAVEQTAQVDIVYPPVYSAESGLTEKQFADVYGRFDKDGNWTPGKLNGMLSTQNKAFDEWNAAHEDSNEIILVRDPETTYKSMMQNLTNAREANPELFIDAEGKHLTNDQVIFRYLRLIAWTERTTAGPVVNGVHTEISRIGEDGMPMYYNNAEEMHALIKMLRCGEQIDIPAKKINTVINYIDKYGNYDGPGKGVGVTNNSFVAYGRDCGDGVSMWRKGVNAVKKMFKPEPDHVDTTVNDSVVVEAVVVEPEQPTVTPDAEVSSVQIKDYPAKDADVTSAQLGDKMTLGKIPGQDNLNKENLGGAGQTRTGGSTTLNIKLGRNSGNGM